MNGRYLNALQELLRPQMVRRRVVPLEDAHSGQVVPLKCHATGLDALVVKLDDIPRAGLSQQDRLYPLLDPTQPDASRCCDYMLFCQREPEQDGDLFVLLAELKRGVGGREQVRNGYLLARWLLSVVALHRPSLSSPRVFFRGLVFSERVDLPKQTTGRRRLRYPAPDARIVGLRVAELPCRARTGYDVDFLLNDCDDAPWRPAP